MAGGKLEEQDDSSAVTISPLSSSWGCPSYLETTLRKSIVTEGGQGLVRSVAFRATDAPV